MDPTPCRLASLFEPSGFLTLKVKASSSTVKSPFSLSSLCCSPLFLTLCNTGCPQIRADIRDRPNKDDTGGVAARSNCPVVRLCIFVNLWCVFNALCHSGVNQFKSFNLCTLDASDCICFVFYSAHPDTIKGSIQILNISLVIMPFHSTKKTSLYVSRSWKILLMFFIHSVYYVYSIDVDFFFL